MSDAGKEFVTTNGGIPLENRPSILRLRLRNQLNRICDAMSCLDRNDPQEAKIWLELALKGHGVFWVPEEKLKGLELRLAKEFAEANPR